MERKTPTIAELEAILNSEPKGRVEIKPAGSVYVADWADRIEWPDPTPDMLKTSEFNAVWEVIKSWDINVPGAYSGYCGATGNHVRAILDALQNIADKGIEGDEMRRFWQFLMEISR